MVAVEKTAETVEEAAETAAAAVATVIAAVVRPMVWLATRAAQEARRRARAAREARVASPGHPVLLEATRVRCRGRPERGAAAKGCRWVQMTFASAPWAAASTWGAFGEFRLGFLEQKTLESCELLPSNFLSGFTILSRAPWCRLWLEICLVGICQESPF